MDTPPPASDDSTLVAGGLSHVSLDGQWLLSSIGADDAPVAGDVPGHWRLSLPGTDGPVLHALDFRLDVADSASPPDRWWLVLDSVHYQSDVSLDGEYLGVTEGHFFAHQFEVGEILATGPEHRLEIEVANAPETDKTAKRKITGVWDHWDQLDPEWNVGGITGSVRLERTGPVRILHDRLVCASCDDRRATLALRVVLDVAAQVEAITLRTTVTGPSGETVRSDDRPVAAGENQLEWTVDISDPVRWWPRQLGEAALHVVSIEVIVDDTVSDQREHTTGLRRVEMDDWIFRINGERLHLKGTNQGPLRLDHAHTSLDEARAFVAQVTDVGLDLIRLDAHVASPHLYRAADEAGVLIWQDFPLQFGYARTIRPQAQRQARELVDLLAHHPSIVLWCAHNEPLPVDAGDNAANDPVALRKIMATMAASQALPTWNKTILDRAVARTIRRADPSRPTVQASGVLPNPPTFDGTDSHLYFGWYFGQRQDLERAIQAIPRLGRFVSEFGAQAVPDTADFCEPDRWPDLDWDELGRRHSCQRLWFDRHVPPGRYATFEAWRAATQDYQATLIRRQVEHLRRLKYRPNGGFAQFCFADANPAISWSVIDHAGEPKPGLAALTAACQPVIVTLDEPPATVAPGEALTLDVHVVSDLREAIEGGEVRATLHHPDGTETWGWRGDLEADAVTLVGSLRLVAPEAVGPAEIELTVTAGDVSASNSYAFELAHPR